MGAIPGLRANRVKRCPHSDPASKMTMAEKKEWVKCPCDQGIQDAVHFFQECAYTSKARVEAIMEATKALETLGGEDLATWNSWPWYAQNKHVLSQAQRLSNKAETLVRSAAAKAWVTHTQILSEEWLTEHWTHHEAEAGANFPVVADGTA